MRKLNSDVIFIPNTIINRVFGLLGRDSSFADDNFIFMGKREYRSRVKFDFKYGHIPITISMKYSHYTIIHAQPKPIKFMNCVVETKLDGTINTMMDGYGKFDSTAKGIIIKPL